MAADPSAAPAPAPAAAATGRGAQPLRHMGPGWYSLVMGLCGLALAWHAAVPLLGDLADGVSLVAGALAAVVFAVLAVATVLRGLRHPEAWAEDRRHPVRHTFVATLPIAVILLATLGTALFGAHPALLALWALGAAGQLGVTLWVLARWLRPGGGAGGVPGAPGGLAWGSVTPALFIPVVGNVLVPLAGVPLGQGHWALAQFGVGLLFWPLVTALLLVRLAVQGPWPERLMPTGFILVAPPAVVGLSALALGAPQAAAWLCWGMAMFSLAWVATLARRIAALPFALPHWALSFPLAAAAALTLRLAGSSGPMAVAGMLLLALASLVVLGLLAGTARGLRDGTLLAPEPVAAIHPAPKGA
jgi:tellurite resistance protein